MGPLVSGPMETAEEGIRLSSGVIARIEHARAGEGRERTCAGTERTLTPGESGYFPTVFFFNLFLLAEGSPRASRDFFIVQIHFYVIWYMTALLPHAARLKSIL